MSKNVFIFGNGEIAEIADYYFTNDSGFNVMGFIVSDDNYSSSTFNGRCVVSSSDFVKEKSPNEASVFIGVSYAQLNSKRDQAYRFFSQNGFNFATYISSKAIVSQNTIIGEGSFILEGNNIQYGVKLCPNVMLWSGNHIGHGSVIRSHAYLASHVVVSGHCDIGERTFIGVNATLMDHCSVGDDCFIAMDASITRNIKPGSVVLGAKSKYIPLDDPLNEKVKRSYFFR